MTVENTTRRDAPRAAAVPDKTGAMPLGARRLLMVGGLCVPIGLVAGPYVLGAQLLAVAGVVMVAVALSHRVQALWFSRLSWVAAAAGALWMAATAAYWGSVIAAADSSAPPPGFAPVLFNAGAGFFAVMAGAAVAAMTLRMVRANSRSGQPDRRTADQ